MALSSRQPPPPTIAVVAPQAIEPITEAEPCQAGRGGSVTPSPSTNPEEAAESADDSLDVPRVRRCVGDPPRQTEDPQSPPCVPYWEGDNGGSTYKGVTRDEIRIAAPPPGSD